LIATPRRRRTSVALAAAETLRVRPVIRDVARYAAAPLEVAGYRLPAGVTVMPAIALVHWGERFAEADEVRPER
jgi:cytochrome P450